MSLTICRSILAKAVKIEGANETVDAPYSCDMFYPPDFRFIAAIVDQFQFLHQLTANLRDLLLLSPRVLHQQLLLWRPREGPSIISPAHTLGIIVRIRYLPDRQIERPVQMDFSHVSYCNDSLEKCLRYNG